MSTPRAPRPQLTPRQNMFQTIMLIVCAFMAIQLYFNSNKPQTTDKTTAAEYLTRLQDDNAKVKDVSIDNVRKSFDAKLDEEVKAATLGKADANKLKFQADLIVADAQLKGGTISKNYGKLLNAFQAIERLKKSNGKSALWNEVVPLPDATSDPRFGYGPQTPQQIYDRASDELRVVGRNDQVWGFFPGFQFIDFLVGLTGRNPAFSYAFAAILLAIVVRAAIWPLSQKQVMFGRQMSQLSPLIKEIREKYKDDTAEQQKKTMELYKEYGINPLAGCLPAFIQMPIFLLLYQAMLHYRFEFQKGTFLWINATTASHTNGFTAPNLGQTDSLLIILYAITMLTSTLLTPVSDPSQKKQQRLIGVGITILFSGSMLFGIYTVPAAFALYWTCTNVLSSAQYIRAYRLPAPPLVKVNASGGGVYPTGALGKIMSNGSKNGHAPVLEQTRTGTPARQRPKKRK